MTDREYQRKLSKIKAHNKQVKMRRKLREERFKLFPKFKFPSTSKLVLLAVFLLNIHIIWYVEHIMDKYGDLSALYALIGVPATLIPSVLAYMHKAGKENQIGGITYDMAMSEMQNQITDTVVSDDEGSVG